MFISTWIFFCLDLDAVKTICNESLSQTNTQIPDEGNPKDGEEFNPSTFNSDDCNIRGCCPLCATNSSIYSCPVDCTSYGLSFNCTSKNAPVYATSITLSGLIQTSLEFERSFLNLRKITIINCTLSMLLIQARGVQTLTIINTNAQLIFIDSDSLRLLHITNCTFDSFSIFKTFMDNIDIFIHKSSVKDGTSLNFNVLLDVSESIGFHNLIDDAFDHRPAIVNLSLCNLDNPPQFRMGITTLYLSHNNLSAWFYSSRIQKIHLQNNSERSNLQAI